MCGLITANYRAGAKRTEKSSYRSGGNSKRKTTPKNRGRRGKKVSSRHTKSRMSLVPVDDIRGYGGKKKGSTIREKLQTIAKQGQIAYKDMYRRAKVRLLGWSK